MPDHHSHHWPLTTNQHTEASMSDHHSHHWPLTTDRWPLTSTQRRLCQIIILTTDHWPAHRGVYVRSSFSSLWADMTNQIPSKGTCVSMANWHDGYVARHADTDTRRYTTVRQRVRKTQPTAKLWKNTHFTHTTTSFAYFLFNQPTSLELLQITLVLQGRNPGFTHSGNN